MPNTMTRYNPIPTYTRLPELLEGFFRDNFLVPLTTDRPFNWEYTYSWPYKMMSNLLETEETFVVQLFLPGLDLEKVFIQVVNRQLTIKGTTFIPMVENATYLWHGLYGFEFNEVFTLPTDVDGEKAVAEYTNGILTITLPKTVQAIAKPIKVHATT